MNFLRFDQSYWNLHVHMNFGHGGPNSNVMEPFLSAPATGFASLLYDSGSRNDSRATKSLPPDCSQCSGNTALSALATLLE